MIFTDRGDNVRVPATRVADSAVELSRLQGRLNGMQVQDCHLSLLWRWESDAAQGVLELVAGPPSAYVRFRFKTPMMYRESSSVAQ